MLERRFISFLRRSPSTSEKVVAEEGKAKTWGRRLVSGTLICLTGGVALSALDDLSIYHSCSRKALEKASNNKTIIDAIGEPVVRGPWYNASLAVAHQRKSVSCTFPVSGPQGTGIFQLKAVRNGEEKWTSFLRPATGKYSLWKLSSMSRGMKRSSKHFGSGFQMTYFYQLVTHARIVHLRNRLVVWRRNDLDLFCHASVGLFFLLHTNDSQDKKLYLGDLKFPVPKHPIYACWKEGSYCYILFEHVSVILFKL